MGGFWEWQHYENKAAARQLVEPVCMPEFLAYFVGAPFEEELVVDDLGDLAAPALGLPEGRPA